MHGSVNRSYLLCNRLFSLRNATRMLRRVLLRNSFFRHGTTSTQVPGKLPSKQEVLVPSTFATWVVLCGGVAQSLLLAFNTCARSSSGDEHVKKESTINSVYYVLRAAICWPSDLLFVATHASPSRYEDDLRTLASQQPLKARRRFQNVVKLEHKIKTFKLWYGDTDLSDHFEEELDCMLACPPGSTTRRSEEPEKYMPYLETCVKWELVGFQPMRFVLKETSNKVLLSTVLTASVAATSLALLSERSFLRLFTNVFRSHGVAYVYCVTLLMNFVSKYSRYKSS
jgi:hypothetical protein